MEKINNIQVKPVRNQEGEGKKAKGYKLFMEPYSNIFCLARKKSGKTTVIYEILRRCTSPKTKIVFICSTVNKDFIYREMVRHFKKRGNKVAKYTALKEDGVNVIDLELELLRLFLKHLGKPRARQSKSKKDKRVIISDFNRLEHENRNQVNNQIDQLRREKYIKIHEVEAAEERAKKQQQRDEQDREEDLRRQLAREGRLIEDIRDANNRRALIAAAPAEAPPLPRIPRPALGNRRAPPPPPPPDRKSPAREEKDANTGIVVNDEVFVAGDIVELMNQAINSKTALQKSEEEKRRVEAAALLEQKNSMTRDQKNNAIIREQAVKLALEQKATNEFTVLTLREVAGILMPYGYTGSISNRGIKRDLIEFLVYGKGKDLRIGESLGARGFYASMEELEEKSGKEQKGTGRSIIHNRISESFTVAKIRKLLKKKDWMWKMTKPVLIDILMDKMDEDDDLIEKVEAVIRPEPQTGGGVGEVKEGLMTNDIDDIMKDEKTYAGTIPSDKIANLKIGGLRKYGFIMNLDPSTKPGIHWIAVWLDYDGDKTIEIYDPLAEYEPTQSFLKQIKDIVDNTKNLDHYLLLKINKIKNQSDSTDTCGWHSIKFLKERAKGNRWKFASGYTDLEEDKIKQFKKQYGYGYDTFV